MKEIKPILKWAGGKQTLLSDLDDIFSMFDFSGHTYFEPFVGGGSVFLHLQKENIVINDFNNELINVYSVIKDEPVLLIEKLKQHQKKHCSDYFYYIRSMDRRNDFGSISKVDLAARTIYLNRTCFNGLMRYNKNGYFNVPIGKYENPAIVLEDRIIDINKYLNKNNVEMICGDFENACKNVKSGDIVYFDPPYDYETDGFTDYTKNGWNRNELVRLKNLCDLLIKKGAHIVVSNNDTKFVNELFSGYNIKHIFAHRFINSNGKNRSNAREVIIYE